MISQILKESHERYNKVREYLCLAANHAPNQNLPASYYAGRIREEWRGRYLLEVLLIIEELFEEIKNVENKPPLVYDPDAGKVKPVRITELPVWECASCGCLNGVGACTQCGKFPSANTNAVNRHKSIFNCFRRRQ